MQKSMEARWQQSRYTSLHAAIISSDHTGGFYALTKSLRLLLQSIMLAAGAYLAIKNEITPGTMIAGSILMGRAMAPIETTISQWHFIAHTFNAWCSLKNSLPKNYKMQKTYSKQPSAHLAVQDLGVFSNRKSKMALQAINFTLEPGEVLGVIGKNGAGKSTLANALVGLTDPNIGDIRIDGVCRQNYDPEMLGQYIGYLPQTVSLFNGSVAENIARMDQRPDHEIVETALRLARAEQMVKALPDSYNTQINNGTQYLSSGQIQRLGLARAVYSEPTILILDEPNAALDADGSEDINAIIHHFKKQGKIIIIMTHRPLAISECDKLLYLVDGRQHAYGQRDKVLNSIARNAHDIRKISA